MKARFEAQYGLTAYDARALTASRELAAFFEATAAVTVSPKLAANWVMGELSAALHANDLDIAHAPVSAAIPATGPPP